MLNPNPVIRRSRENNSCSPVKTARYLIDVVMNEDDPNATHQTLVTRFKEEFQRALNGGYFAAIRYDSLDFKVTRELLDEAPARGEHAR